MRQRGPAKPTHWKTEPMPAENTVISLDLRFSKTELEIIKRGVIPEEMEDKWFIYWKDDELFFHRSWTGICIYVVHFICDEEGAAARIATANRNREQYAKSDEEYDARMVLFLINALLLKRRALFPSKQPTDEMRALEMFHLIGDAALGRHPGTDRPPRFQIKTRCFLCVHKFTGHPGCQAFPEGLPHALAIGDVLHEDPFPDDRGYRFEQRDSKAKKECQPIYKGWVIRIPVDKLHALAPRCAFDAESIVHRSHQNSVDFFRRLDTVGARELVIGASLTHPPVPIGLKSGSEGSLERLAGMVDAVKKGNDLDKDNLEVLKDATDNSLIGVTKLLHFANPERYPIVDGSVGDFLRSRGQRVNTDDPAWYIAYTCAMRQSAELPMARSIQRTISDAVGYGVSTLRALELVMHFSASQAAEMKTTSTNGTTKQYPPSHATIPLDLEYDGAEMALIQQGHFPELMVDRWWVYWDDNTLSFRRSWRVYRIRFEIHGMGGKAVEAEVPASGGKCPDALVPRHADLIRYLIDALLLRKQVEYPPGPLTGFRGGVEQWIEAERADLEAAPEEKKNRLPNKSRCFLCQHKFDGHPGCMAFPANVPPNLAFGLKMHDEEFPGDRGYRFEAERNRRRVRCPHLYRGEEVEIPIDRVIEDVEHCDLTEEPSVHLSYRAFVSHFENLCFVTPQEFIVGASLAYSWMPTALEFKSPGNLDDAAAYVDAVMKGNDLDDRAMGLVKSVVNNSVVGTSKLLHFVNPDRYVIYDSRVDTYLYGKPSQTRLTSIDHYMSYVCGCREAVKDPRFSEVHRKVNRLLRYEVSALRALELVMFFSARQEAKS